MLQQLHRSWCNLMVFFNSSWYSMIPFILFIHQPFHVLLPWIFNPFLVYNHFTQYSFQTVWPRYIHFLFTICFAIRWLGSFKLLAHFFCFFPFAEEITFFAFCLLFLYSFHASVDFSFFNFHTFSSFPLLLQQLPDSTTIFLYDCMGLLTIHMWPVLFPSYFSYVASVHSAFLSLTMPWYSSHVFSSLNFHAHTLGSNFLRHLFVVLFNRNQNNKISSYVHQSSRKPKLGCFLRHGVHCCCFSKLLV